MQAGAGAEARLHRRGLRGGGRDRGPRRRGHPGGRRPRRPGRTRPRRRGGRRLPAGRRDPELLRRRAVRGRAARPWPARRATVFSFDLVPRISRAQGMDALSSQATVSGYRAGLAAAEHLAKFFPMFMTAAGTVPPAKVLVMGVGRRRAAGDRHGPAPRRRGQGLRRAGRGQGGGGEPRRHLPRHSASRPRGRAATPASSRPRSWTASAPRWPRRSGAPTSSSPPPRCPGRKAPVLLTAAMVEGMAAGRGGGRHGRRPGRQLRADPRPARW